MQYIYIPYKIFIEGPFQPRERTGRPRRPWMSPSSGGPLRWLWPPGHRCGPSLRGPSRWGQCAFYPRGQRPSRGYLSSAWLHHVRSKYRRDGVLLLNFFLTNTNTMCGLDTDEVVLFIFVLPRFFAFFPSIFLSKNCLQARIITTLNPNEYWVSDEARGKIKLLNDILDCKWNNEKNKKDK